MTADNTIAQSTDGTQHNPFRQITTARNELSSASNYLDDAVGVIHESEFQPTREQADNHADEIDRFIRDAERCIRRARERLGIEQPQDGDGDE